MPACLRAYLSTWLAPLHRFSPPSSATHSFPSLPAGSILTKMAGSEQQRVPREVSRQETEAVGRPGPWKPPPSEYAEASPACWAPGLVGVHLVSFGSHALFHGRAEGPRASELPLVLRLGWSIGSWMVHPVAVPVLGSCSKQLSLAPTAVESRAGRGVPCLLLAA